MNVLIEEDRVGQGFEEAEETNFLPQFMRFVKQTGKNRVVIRAFQNIETLAASDDSERFSG